MWVRVVFISIVVALFSCKSDSESPDVVGSWQSGAVIITYNEDLTYGIKYLSKGDAQNPVPNDSVFGVYNIDTYSTEESWIFGQPCFYFLAEFYLTG